MTKHLEIGDKAPDFELSGDVNLSHYHGKQNVVLYFYPKDDTPGCTVEAKEFRDMQGDFEKSHTVIIGVSKDDATSHNKFKEKFSLNFALGSDEETKTCQKYGCWVEKNMYGKTYMGIQRDTFLIDKNGKIAGIWRKVKPEGHAKEMLEAAKKLA